MAAAAVQANGRRTVLRDQWTHRLDNEYAEY